MLPKQNILYFILQEKILLLVKLRKLAWASTNKSTLQSLYCHQKHARRIVNLKDKSTSAKPQLEQINAMTVYEVYIFQTLFFMYLCKNGNTPSTFKLF